MNVLNITVLCCLVLMFSVGAHSKKVLLVSCQITSHFFEMNAMSTGLIQNGHDVYVTLSRGFPKPDKVIKAGITPLYFDPVPGYLDIDTVISKLFEISFEEVGGNTSKSALDDCIAMMNDESLNKQIRDIGFDLAIADGFVLSFCPLLLPHVHGIPYVYLFSGVHPWITSTPALPSFVPLTQGVQLVSDKMTFVQRLRNLAEYIFLLKFFPLIGRTDTSLLRQYAPEVESWEHLAYKSVLFIETRDFIMERASPAMPNFIQTPGITMTPAKPLSPDFQKLMDSADKGVVLVSFGSMASNFPDDITRKLVDAFNELTEYTIVWKFSGKHVDSMKKRAKGHVHLLGWLPQNDLLAHKNVKVFLTHCGNNGQHESIYHAVPMVGLPIFAEQFHNAFRSQDRGYGLSLLPGGIKDFTVPDLVAAVRKVATETRYKEAVSKASSMLRDSPMDPVETATYWLEHVMKYGGEHLRSHGTDMPWYQYFMIDVMLFVAAIMHVALYVIYRIVKKVLNMMLGGSKTKAKAE